MVKVAIIGCGAIAAAVLELLVEDQDIVIISIVAREGSFSSARALADRLAPSAQVASQFGQLEERPDVLVECASHEAVAAHVLPALGQGIYCIVASIGAMGDAALAIELKSAALRGQTKLQLVSGAIGGIDALAAASVGGLQSVSYTGRKAPLAWKGTPAAERVDLDHLDQEAAIFDGSAREASQLYPKNANVTATLSVAGLGFDATQVTLLADPKSSENVHHYRAQGTFGSFELTIRGKPLASNPKTSALTVYSVVRAIRNLASPVVI